MSHKLPICSDAAEKAIKNDDTKDTEYHPNFLQAVISRRHRVPQLSTCCDFNDDDCDDDDGDDDCDDDDGDDDCDDDDDDDDDDCDEDEDEEESPQSGLAVGLAPQN